MRTGDIELIPFPFSELTNIKIRPSVVISETKDKYRDLILAAISSQVPQKESPAELIIPPDSLNGLLKISVISRQNIYFKSQQDHNEARYIECISSRKL